MTPDYRAFSLSPNRCDRCWEDIEVSIRRIVTTTDSGGFGWGLCIRGVGTTNFLVRAVVIDGKERGMTAFARLVAEALGIGLGPSVAGDFHVPSGVADATRNTRLRLVLV